MSTSDSVRSSKQERLAKLLEDYDAVSRQLAAEISELNRGRLQRQLDDLEREIVPLESELVGQIEAAFAPPPPGEVYVPRHEPYAALKARLLGKDGQPLKGTVVMQGGPGFGKTTLAQAIYQDPDIRRAYSGGLLWTTVGEQGRDPLLILGMMANKLGATESFRSLEVARGRLKDLLQGRDVLLVLDDVWQEDHIKELPGPDLCMRLITTRVGDVALLDRERFVHIDEMTHEEATQTLIKWLPAMGREPNSQECEGLGALAARLGEWPLLLGLFGRGLRVEMGLGGLTLLQALKQVQQDLDDVGLTAQDEDDAGVPIDRKRIKSLALSMEASLHRFTDAERLRLYELGIFREDDEIPEAAALRLWRATAGLARVQAHRLLLRFSWQFFDLRPLAEDSPPTLRIHDRIREYLGQQLGAERASAAHQALLDSYNTAAEPWHRIADDGYLYDHLTYHLHGAGAPDQVLRLLDTDEWMIARFAQCGYTYTGFIQDVMAAWGVAQAQAGAEIEAGAEFQALADCVHCALARATINSLAANFVPQVLVQAVKTGLWTGQRALAVAASIPDSMARMQMHVALLPVLSGRERDSALQQALDVAREIEYPEYHFGDLAALTLELQGDQREEVLSLALRAAREIRDDDKRSRALVALEPQLPENQRARVLEEALQAAQGIWNSDDRSYALAALASRLEGEKREQVLAQALQSAWEAGINHSRFSALVDLVPQLQGALLEQALQHALEMHRSAERCSVLAALAPRLQGQQREQVLERALQDAQEIGGGYSGALALAALIPQLPDQRREQLLEHALQRWHYYADFPLMVAVLAPHLQGSLLEQALQDAEGIGRATDRFRALAALAPRVDGARRERVLEQALQAAQAALSTYERASALAELASQLRGALLEQALYIAREIWDEISRVSAIAVLTLHVQQPQRERVLQQALRAVQAIRPGDQSNPSHYLDDRDRSRALGALAPQLQGALLEQALRIAREMYDGNSRSLALTALAPQLNGALLQQALQDAREIGNPDDRSPALAALAMQLPGEERERVLAQAMEDVRGIVDYPELLRALTALAPQLQGALLEQALMVLQRIADERFFVAALAALASQLHGSLPEQMLQVVREREMRDPWSRSRALAALAPQLQEDQREMVLEQALQSAQEIWDHDLRASALAELATRLQGTQREQALEQALQDAGEIGYAKERFAALVALAPRLEGQRHEMVLRQLLQTARQIEPVKERSRALAALAAQLPGALLQEALQAVREIGDPASRCSALATYARVTGATSLRSEARQAVMVSLRQLANPSRQDVLQFLADSEILAPPICSPALLLAIAECLIDICENWRWQ